MAYTPTTWNTGDTINATKLNKIEQGIANAGGDGGWDIVIEIADGNISMRTGTLTLKSNKTAADLYDKLVDHESVSCIVYDTGGSGLYCGTTPYLCGVQSTSTPDTLFIRSDSWPSGVSIRFNNSGLSYY